MAKQIFPEYWSNTFKVSEETPIISSLNTPCSPIDKKYPECRAKMSVIEEKIIANKSFFITAIFGLRKKFWN